MLYCKQQFFLAEESHFQGVTYALNISDCVMGECVLLKSSEFAVAVFTCVCVCVQILYNVPIKVARAL